MLTPTWEFHHQVGIPRSAAIEYPYGRVFGEVGDRDGQREVLKAVLTVLATVRRPGEVHHLPHVWPQAPKETDWHPPKMSPIIKSYISEIKKARSRENAPKRI